MKYEKLIQFYKRINENPLVSSVIIFTIFFLIFFKIQFSVETLTGFDSWIHIKMARMMLEDGIIYKFPWMQYSIFQWYFADHNFLFHIFQMPFTAGDMIFGAKLATVMFSALFSAVFFYVLKKQKVAVSFLWLSLALSSYFLLSRLNISKVVPVYLSFTLAGYYFISEKKYLPLFLLSFFFVWLHSSFIMVGIMCVLYTLIDWQYHRKFNLKLLSCCIAGIVCGFIINPYFPNNISLWYVQAVEIGVFRPADMTNFGAEWEPITNINHFFFLLYFFFGFFAVGLYFFIKNKKSMRQLFALSLVVVFGFLSFMSHRHMEFLIPFMTIFSAISLTEPIKTFQKEGWKKGFLSDTAVALAIICFFFLFRIYSIEMDLTDMRGYEDCSQWLINNSEQGSIVASRWDVFPFLFHYNTWNYYIIGMDMGFLYKYNETLYHLYDDAVFGYGLDIKETVKKYFNSSYYVADSEREVPIIYELQETAEISFSNERCVVFRL